MNYLPHKLCIHINIYLNTYILFKNIRCYWEIQSRVEFWILVLSNVCVHIKKFEVYLKFLSKEQYKLQLGASMLEWTFMVKNALKTLIHSPNLNFFQVQFGIM
jgi:hypothetical protein